jgi:E3 ubiquitin-protein ligase UBR4
MAEIARLVEVVFDDAASSSDLSYKLRSDASLKLGLEKVYSILKLGVEPAGNGKLGFECWEKAQVQAVSSVAYAIAYATRSISVEQAEPVIIAAVQQALEFAICCLEKSVPSGDDLTVQNNFVQILEIALIAGMDKDSDLPQPSFGNALLDPLLASAAGNGNVDINENVRCIFQGIEFVTYKISPSLFHFFF